MPDMSQLMGIRTRDSTGFPSCIAGRIRNCGERATAAAPKPRPWGSSDTGRQSRRTPWTVTTHAMTAFPLRLFR